MAPQKIIIVVCRHVVFDYVLKLVVVHQTADNVWEEPPAAVVYAGTSAYENADKVTRKLIDLADKISDEGLMKRFSREKQTTKFLQNLSLDLVEHYIHPFIWNIHTEMLDLMRRNLLPLYIRASQQKHIYLSDDEIIIPQATAHAVMYFRRDEMGNIHYSVSIDDDGREIDIFRKPFRCLCESPATVLVGKSLLMFNDIDFSKLQTFFTKQEILVPSEKAALNIQKFIAQCAKKYVIHVDGINLQTVYDEPISQLTLTSNLHGTLALQLVFSYGSHIRKYGTSNAKQVWTDTTANPPRITVLTPYFEFEQQCVKELLENGLEDKNYFFYVHSDDEADAPLLIDWIKTHTDLLQKFHFTQENTDVKYFLGEQRINSSVEEGNDWFDLHAEAQFDDMKVPFSDLMQTLLDGRREYVLPDKSIAIIPQEWIEKYSRIAHFGKHKDGKIRLYKAQYQLVGEITDSKRLANLTFSDKDILPQPQGLAATLRHYQQIGFSFLVHRIKNGFGACLADDMGLGKTIQTISLLLQLKNMGANVKKEKSIEKDSSKHKPSVKNKQTKVQQLTIFDEMAINTNEEPKTEIAQPKSLPSIIVLPTSLVHNWIVELKRFAPTMTYYAYFGSKRAKLTDKNTNLFDVIFTTYGTLRNDIEILEKCRFNLLILDESQNIKNVNSEVHKAIKRIQCQQSIALSGTPIENSLIDLWSLFDVINPSLLGSQLAFKRQYVNAIPGKTAEMQNKSLLKMVEPFIMRRTKEIAAPELPPLQEEVLYCDMTDAQRHQYDEERSKLRNVLSEIKLSFANQSNGQMAIATLQGLTRLRLLANHPFMFNPNYKGDSGKFKEVMDRLEMLRQGGHKVLVFSSFVKHLRLYADEFERRKWNFSYLIGSSSAEERQAQIDRFTEDISISTFFISLKAGGVGLNLTVADYVFLLDPWWNPAIESQAVSRAHRIGQQKSVIVYRFITTESIEEKIRNLQEAKSKLADTFINNSNPLRNLSPDGLLSLTEN